MNLREGKIGTREGVAVLSAALLSKAMIPLFLPGLAHTAWLANISAAIIAASGLMLALWLSRGEGYLEALNNNLGIVGRIFALVLCALIVFNAARTLSAFHAILKIFIYTKTDALILMGLLTLAAAIPAYMGFECVSRTAKAFFVIMLCVLACVLLLPWKQYDLSRLFPLWGDGLTPALWNGVSESLLYLDLMGAAVLVGALHGEKQARRIGFIALGLSAGAAILMLFAAALTFSPGMLWDTTAPFYSMASGIAMNQVFTRVEDFFIFLWIMCAVVGVSFTLYLASNVFCRTFGVTEIRPVVPLMCLVALFLALLTKASPVFQGVERFIAAYGFLFAFGPIVLAALVVIFKRRRAAAKVKAAKS